MHPLLVSGIPGAGKTSVSARLAARLPRSAHLEGDAVGQLVVSGNVLPGGSPPGEATAQLALRRRNLCLLADSLSSAGFVPVIDDVVVSPAVLDLYLSALKARPFGLVVLTPRLEVVRARDAGRDKHVFDLWSHLDKELRTTMPRIGLWLDTSELDADETADQILCRVDETVIAK
jgi:predicted kinase